MNILGEKENKKKKQFLELAFRELEKLYEDVPKDCSEKKFSAIFNYSVLFTDNFNDDFDLIEKHFSQSVIDYLKNNLNKQGLAEIDEQLDDGSYHRTVIIQALAPQDN